MTFWDILEFSKKAKIICEECNEELNYSIAGSISHEGEKLQINIEKHCNKKVVK